MLTSNKNIDKIESAQMMMRLPRMIHTSEAFWALNILPFRKLLMFNVVKFLFVFKGDRLKKFHTIKKISKTQILETE